VYGIAASCTYFALPSQMNKSIIIIQKVFKTTRSSFVSCAGEATAAGKVANDEKHLAAVEKVVAS